MSAFQCPDCQGGFPEPANVEEELRCPWCSNKLKHDPATWRVRRVSKVETDGSEESTGMLELFR